MVPFKFKHVCIESCAVNLPPNEVTSAALEDKLAPLYQKLGIPFGTLERLSGVETRYFWDLDVLPSQVSTEAAKRAIELSGFDTKQIQALFSCSVTRDLFEPATACIVHQNLGLAEDSLAMDISNACIGFSSGLVTLATMIEQGIVKAGVVVSGEVLGRIINHNLDHILENQDKISRDDLIRLLPAYTLGSGSVAWVLCHDSISKNKHRIIGGALRSATQFADLCEGNGDYFYRQLKNFCPIMYTESSKLIAAAAQLGGRTWEDASQVLEWKKDDIDHIFCHQVGRQVNDAFYKTMGLEMEKEYTIYRKYGNLISAAMPTAVTLGIEEKGIKSGEKILFTAFGSGLNSCFMGVQW